MRRANKEKSSFNSRWLIPPLTLSDWEGVDGIQWCMCYIAYELYILYLVYIGVYGMV